MTFTAFIELIGGVLQFPNEVIALIKLLKGTAAQADADIVAKAQSDWDKMQKTGRPTWE